LAYLKNNSVNAHEDKRNAVTKVTVLTLLAYLKSNAYQERRNAVTTVEDLYQQY
jgi:hypothetical protein